MGRYGVESGSRDPRSDLVKYIKVDKNKRKGKIQVDESADHGVRQGTQGHKRP